MDGAAVNPARCAMRENTGSHPHGQKPKLSGHLREALRPRLYSPRTGQTYRHWGKGHIHFHNVRHPTQNQALSALLFLYRHALAREAGDLGEVIRIAGGVLCRDLAAQRCYEEPYNQCYAHR